MTNSKFKILIIVLIVLLAAFLRIWKLTQFPAGFNADEAAIGYNAWSILQTGKDEFGNFLPIAFTSFGDFKPPLYFYLDIPFIAIFGLTEWGVRLPSAIFGILTVLTVFFLVQRIFKNFWLAAFASLLLAISPWHLHYSRGGWETNLFTFLLTLGIFLFLKSWQDKKWIFVSSIVLALSFYSYQGARVITPVMVLVLLVIFYKEILKMKKETIIAGILGILVIIPALATFLTGAGASRFSGVSIFADPGPFWRTNELRGQHSNPNDLISEIFHNKAVAYGSSFFTKYFEHFSGNFLFITGDPIPRNNVVETGVAYWFDLLFLPVGFYFLLSKRQKFWYLLPLWFFTAPIASAFTFQSPQALRAANMVVPLVIISAYGFYHLMRSLQFFKKVFPLFLILTSLFLLYSFARYLHQYYVHNPKAQPIAFEYGFAQLVPKVMALKDKYDKVIVTDHYDQPYILFLFYSKYEPTKFQKEAVLTSRDKFGFSTVRNFNKFEFRKINWQDDAKLENTLIVGTSEEITEDVKILDQVLNPNGSIAFKMVGT